MKKISFGIITIGVLLVFSSCKILYTPNMQNVPLMREKGDLGASIAFSNAQVSYAITDNIGIIGNGFLRNRSWSLGGDIDIWHYNSQRYLAEGGLGYFKNFNDDIIFEVFAGAGYGKVKWDYDNLDLTINKTFDAKMTNFFIQPNFGFKNDFIDIAISGRFNGIRFYNVRTSNFTLDDLTYDNLHNIDQHPYIFFEPAITFRAGYKYIKAHTQFSYSAKLNSENLNYRPYSVYAGLQINLNALKGFR